MDLRRHAATLWRFRIIVGTGIAAGIVLAVLATFHVSSSGLEWRKPFVYQSSSVLFVTQPGFPWGRANLPVDTPGESSAESETLKNDQDQNFADPSRFSGLASIYSFMARSEGVRRLVPGYPPETAVAAEPFRSNPGGGGGDTLPVIGLTTSAASAEGAQQLNENVITALTKYLRSQQDDSKTPAAARAQVQVLNPPDAAVVSEGHEMTGGIVLLLLCLLASVALSYLLENLRPAQTYTDDDLLPEFDDDEAWADEVALPDPAAFHAGRGSS